MSSEVTIGTTTAADVTDVTDVTDGRPMRVEHRGGDRFDISVRGHIISVDQPV